MLHIYINKVAWGVGLLLLALIALLSWLKAGGKL